MKTRKQQRLCLCLLASTLGLLATGCSDETTQMDAPALTGAGERITVTASAGMPQGGGADTRLYFVSNETGDKLVITWSTNYEYFSVLAGTGITTPELFTQTGIDDDNHNATFEGKISLADPDTYYYAVYPELPAGTTEATIAAIPLDMAKQWGNVYPQNQLYMYAKSKYDSSGRNLNFKFTHLNSILEVTLQFPKETTSGVEDMLIKPLTRSSFPKEVCDNVTITASSGLMSKAIVDLTGNSPAYKEITSGCISVSGPFHFYEDTPSSFPVLLSVIPGTLTDLAVTVTSKDGKLYKGVISASTKIEAGIMYTATAEMEEVDPAKIKVTCGADYNYNGLPIEIGTFRDDDPANRVSLGTGTISGGEATVPVDLNLYKDKPIWVCIPKVAKFFHTVTAEEAVANALTLPDKDGGSTLKTSPTIGADNKAYENDWIVALYMGINKNNAPTATFGDGAIPLYWATGNLIATKTNAANSGTTEATFHIATAEETAKEGTAEGGSETTPYDAVRAEGKTDGYSACNLGDQWNLFGWGDATGVMTSTNDGDYAPDVITDSKSICGTANDIARAQLGGSWRLPSGGTAGNTNSGELHVIMDLNLEKYSNNGNGRKWIYNAGTADTPITNTLLLPAAGMYDKSEMSEVLEMKYRGKYDCYWSGSSGNGVNAYALDLGANADASDVSWHSDKRSGSRSVRPVTE